MGKYPQFCCLLLVCLLPFVSATSVNATRVNSAILDIPGSIAYIGADYDVYTLSLQESDIPIQLTSNADAQHHYQWPTWGIDQRLSFFCCVGEATGSLQVFVTHSGLEENTLVYENAGNNYTYASWSPVTCSWPDVCGDLAIITTSRFNERGLTLIPPAPNLNVVGTIAVPGHPDGFSWSPDGTRLIWKSSESQLAIYNVTDNSIENIDISLGQFGAPTWSPVDDRVLVAIPDGDSLTSAIAVLANSQTTVLQIGLRGTVNFNWSPDGNYIAYRVVNDIGPNQLFILDAITGDIIAESDTGGVIAFFWSPDGDRIAYLTPASLPDTLIGNSRVDLQQALGIAWSVLDVDANSVHHYSGFLPTQEMYNLIERYDQFAQSHRVWSPDSTHIVFAEMTPAGLPSISILDTTRADTVPFSLTVGVIGFWSYDS